MKSSFASLAAALLASSPVASHAATKYIDLGGPATGYLAVANFKNSTSQYGIEGRDDEGNPLAEHNGLPDYPNYRIPAGNTYAGLYTAIIASPLSPSSDYSALYTYNGVTPGATTVNNLTVTDSNHSTMSAGLISYNDSLISGTGTETIPVSALSFNFDTYLWDGKTQNGWTVFSTPTYISPFSPAYTSYNDSSGAGNAAIVYNLSLANITGTGLTFVDGQLVSMNIDADLNVLLRAGYFPDFPPAAGATFTGTFSADGLGYAFDVDGFNSGFGFTDVHMVMNRAGTASVIPEPSALVLSALGLLAAFRRNRASDRF